MTDTATNRGSHNVKEEYGIANIQKFDWSQNSNSIFHYYFAHLNQVTKQIQV